MIYVDDLLLVGPDLDDLNIFKKELSSSFQISELWRFYLLLRDVCNKGPRGASIESNPGDIHQKILQNTSMQDSKPVSTPIEADNRLEKANSRYEATPEFRTKYQSIVGSFMYAMLGTRPDIAFAVSTVN